ncbi:MAG: hypothetical protein WCA08_08945 [Desulfoferrobacter sp.]
MNPSFFRLQYPNNGCNAHTKLVVLPDCGENMGHMAVDWAGLFEIQQATMPYQTLPLEVVRNWSTK